MAHPKLTRHSGGSTASQKHLTTSISGQVYRFDEHREPEGFSEVGILLGRKAGGSPYLLGVLRCQMLHILYLTSSTAILSVFLTTESPEPSRIDTG